MSIETLTLLKKIYDYLGYAGAGKAALHDEMSMYLQLMGRVQYQAARRAFADGEIDAAIACLYSAYEAFYTDATKDTLARRIKNYLLGMTIGYNCPEEDTFRMACETVVLLATCFHEQQKKQLTEKYKNLALNCFRKYEEARIQNNLQGGRGSVADGVGLLYREEDPYVRKELNIEKKQLLLVFERL